MALPPAAVGLTARRILQRAVISRIGTGIAGRERSGGGVVFVAAILAGLLVVLQLCVVAPLNAVERVLSALVVRPALQLGLDAEQASKRCDFGGGDGTQGMLALLGQAYLATGAGPPGPDGASPFGAYANPLAGLSVDRYDPMADSRDLEIEPQLLARGGEVQRLLALPDGRTPAQWSTLGPLHGEHGIGFLLITPSDWRIWTDGSPTLRSRLGAGQVAALDPYRPRDAFLVMACHLLDLVHQVNPGRTGTGWSGSRIAAALAQYGRTVPQLWPDVATLLPGITDDVGRGDAARGMKKATVLPGAPAGAAQPDHGDRYSELLGSFMEPGPGTPGFRGVTPIWPSSPEPIPIGAGGLVPLPPDLDAPTVSPGTFRNPFSDSSQCTWWAYQAYAAFDDQDLGSNLGDAGDWIGRALQVPDLRSRVLTPQMPLFGPVEGAVISFGRSPGMAYGHVGIVRRVARDHAGSTWMLIWDANWDGRGGRYQHWFQWNAWKKRTAGFILPPPPPG